MTTLVFCWKSFNDLEQSFSNINMHGNQLGIFIRMQILTWQVEDSVFLTSSQVMLLVQRPHSEEQE